MSKTIKEVLEWHEKQVSNAMPDASRLSAIDKMPENVALRRLRREFHAECAEALRTAVTGGDLAELSLGQLKVMKGDYDAAALAELSREMLARGSDSTKTPYAVVEDMILNISSYIETLHKLRNEVPAKGVENSIRALWYNSAANSLILANKSLRWAVAP